jgi:group II intron reverse transcriptase/maturase
MINQVLSIDNLRVAWDEVASKKAAPGIDGVTVARWRRNWEDNLVNLAYAVKSNTYTPLPPKYCYIPKKTGGYRQISIISVTDRVIQRAVLRVIDKIFDKAFLECSYGFRSGRGVRQAVARIIELRDLGYKWLVDADIYDCFNQLDHALIKHFFRQTISDPILNRLTAQWLEAGNRQKTSKVGITVGGVISPLYCNIMLHNLDREVTSAGWHMVRYADDFCIFTRSESGAKRVYQSAEKLLHALRLRYNPKKTNITHFNCGFRFLGVSFLRDSYHFDSQHKRISIKGGFDENLFIDYFPKGYY